MALCGAPCLLAAQDDLAPPSAASSYVPLDSWVYPAMERLAALGFVQSQFAGIRPWTRSECVRLIDEASELLQQEFEKPEEALRLHRALEREFAGEMWPLNGRRGRESRLESIYSRITTIAGQPLTDGYHFGQTIVNDYGRPYSQGTNAVAGFSARAAAGRFVLHFRGEYQHAPSLSPLAEQARSAIAAADLTPAPPAASPRPDNQFRLLDSYAAVSLGKLQFSFGKQSLWWGPGRSGPFVFSNNAEPIYMLRVNRVSPFKLPSVLGWLGPVRGEFFLGRLSGHSFPAGPFIHGQKFSFKPTPNLEFGFSRTVVFSGAGRPLTMEAVVRSLLSVGSGLDGNAPDVDPGDRRGGFDFSYRVPGLRKWLVLYNDSLVDDDPSPLAAPRRAAMNPGIYIPQIPRLQKVDFRAEAAYTDVPSGRSTRGQFIYWNVIYRDAYTNKGNLLGNWVGREGRGIQLWSNYWLSPQSTVQIGYRRASVSGDFIPGGGRLSNVAARADLFARPELRVSSFIQYERWSFPVLSAANRSNVAASVELTFYPHSGSE